MAPNIQFFVDLLSFGISPMPPDNLSAQRPWLLTSPCHLYPSNNKTLTDAMVWLLLLRLTAVLSISISPISFCAERKEANSIRLKRHGTRGTNFSTAPACPRAFLRYITTMQRNLTNQRLDNNFSARRSKFEEKWLSETKANLHHPFVLNVYLLTQVSRSFCYGHIVCKFKRNLLLSITRKFFIVVEIIKVVEFQGLL